MCGGVRGGAVNHRCPSRTHNPPMIRPDFNGYKRQRRLYRGFSQSGEPGELPGSLWPIISFVRYKLKVALNNWPSNVPKSHDTMIAASRQVAQQRQRGDTLPWVDPVCPVNYTRDTWCPLHCLRVWGTNYVEHCIARALMTYITYACRVIRIFMPVERKYDDDRPRRNTTLTLRRGMTSPRLQNIINFTRFQV